MAVRLQSALRRLVLVPAAAAAFVAPATVALEPAETARILAGLEPAPAGLSPLARPMIEPYARAVSERWQDYQRHIGEPMRAWARSEIGDAAGGRVFYPLSGPDFITVQQLYPDAAHFVLVALQHADPPPPLEHYSPRELSEFLRRFRLGWERFARLGFFRTPDLDADAEESGIRIGVTAPLMAFAARAGYEIVSVDPVRVSPDGADLEPRAGGRSARGTWESVRLTLAKEGRAVLLDYVRMDLSDAALSRHRASRTWLESAAAHPTVLKAASHLPQRPHFSMLRQAVLARAPSLWQDETGIDYALLAREFDVTLYGRFTKPHPLFLPGSQDALAAAYARQPPRVRPLGFRVGYEKESGSSVQVAVRLARPVAGSVAPAAPTARFGTATALAREIQELEARVARQLERLAARPRKAFVGGRTDKEPFADYVRYVRKHLMASAPKGLPPGGRAALMTLSIGGDGKLHAVEVDRSSGSTAFDRRLRAAAGQLGPFAPLPEPLRERADVLVITFQIPDG
jgi:hypothetical protein